MRSFVKWVLPSKSNKNEKSHPAIVIVAFQPDGLSPGKDRH